MNYWHKEVEWPDDIPRLAEMGIRTVADAERVYDGPSWCVLLQPLSCWGLLYGYVRREGRDYCKGCECHDPDAIELA